MSVIIELFVFFAFCLSQVWIIMESVHLGIYSMLDIICAMMYISITFWGIFSLLEVEGNKNDI